MTSKKKGKGTLIAIGGSEDKRNDLIVLRRVVAEAKGQDTYIEIVTTASSVPRELERTYERAFRKIGVRQFDSINIAYKDEADKKSYIERVRKADVIFFTGGDQLRLTNILGGSDFLTAVKECFEDGTVIAGTSAGAAALSDTMIYSGESKFGLIKSNVFFRTGFEFVENIAFDTHCIGRGRILRLFQVVATNPANIGIGLSEDTAVVISDDHIMDVVGSGSVIIVEGSHLRNSNVSRIDSGELIAVENFHVHSLIADYRYNLKEKKVISYPPDR